MKSIFGALVSLVAGSSAWAQAPCMTAPVKATASLFLEAAPVAKTDSVMTIRLCLGGVKNLGSYMVTARFDSTQLRALSVSATGGGMQATNTRVPGEVRIAGAAPSGFASGELARITFTAPRSPATPVSLEVSEANSISGSSLLKELAIVGWRVPTRPASSPVIDSISPRAGELDNDRVLDITIYGRGFAGTGNSVAFGRAEIPGLKSQGAGTVIRFSAPVIRVEDRAISIRVRHDGLQSNAVTFVVKDDRP